MVSHTYIGSATREAETCKFLELKNSEVPGAKTITVQTKQDIYMVKCLEAEGHQVAVLYTVGIQ